MTKDLAHALKESTERIGNLEFLVRVVLSGGRRNMVPPAERIDIRPVLIKEKLMLQIASNDATMSEIEGELIIGHQMERCHV